jgi:hypothetical protein
VPPDAGYRYLTTFADFLAFGLDKPDDAICYAGWLRTGLWWAHQVREQNPHTFPPAETPDIMNEIRTTWETHFMNAH